MTVGLTSLYRLSTVCVRYNGERAPWRVESRSAQTNTLNGLSGNDIIPGASNDVVSILMLLYLYWPGQNGGEDLELERDLVVVRGALGAGPGGDLDMELDLDR